MKTAEEMHKEIQPLVESGQDEKAISAYEKMLVSHPTSTPAHFDLGMLYLKTGQEKKAFEYLEKAAALEPDNIEFKKIVADFHYTKRGETQKAYELYRDLTDLEPENAETHFITGNLAVALHRFDEAMTFYKTVLDLEPWHAEAADYLEKLQRHTSGGDNSSSAEEMYEKSRALMNEGDENAARNVLTQLVADHPEFAMAHNDLGVLSCRTGDMADALQYFEKAASLAPDDTTIQKNLVEIYYVEAGDYAKALGIGLKLLSKNPEDTEMLMMAGHISFALGRTDDAKLFYNRVLAIEPWNYEAGESLSKAAQPQEPGDLSAASL